MRTHRNHLSAALLALALAGSSLVQANSGCAGELGTFAVVAPYSGGLDLAIRARELGYRVVPILPSPKTPSGYSFEASAFDVEPIVHNGDFHATANAVAQFYVPGQRFGIGVGSEAGGLVADPLRDFVRQRGIHVVGNGARLADARRDKEVLDRVLSPDLKPEQIVSADLVQIQRWVAAHGKWPVMVKQPRGAGGEKSRLCYSHEEVENAFRAILVGRPNGMLEVDRSVVVQEGLFYPEIAINGVRQNGVSYFTGFWLYDRPLREGAGTIYDADWLMYPSPEHHAYIMAAADRVMDQVAHYDGFYHLEAFLSERSPLFTDVNIRPAGHKLHWLEARATNRNPFDVAIKVHMGIPLEGLERLYRRTAFAGTISVSSEGGGARMSYRLRPLLQRLKEQGKIADFEFFFPEGYVLPRTVDSDTVAAAVWVLGDNVVEVRKRMREVQRWRAMKYFEMNP